MLANDFRHRAAATFGKLLPTRRRRRIATTLTLIAAVAVVLWVVTGTGSSSPTTSNSSATTASGSATVRRRDLVETDTESGTLSYANPQTVYNRLSGTITWLPTVGQVIKPGEALYKVDQQPVLLMNGSTPAYRDLTPSDGPGRDVLELNRNLVALGYNPDGIVVDDTWQTATTAGIEALQAALGETQSGTLSLGQVVFLPGDQLISTVDATAGSTGSSSNANTSPGASADDPAPTTGPEFVSMDTKPQTTAQVRPRTKNSLKTLEALIALLRKEIAELRSANRSPRSGNPSATKAGSTSSSNSGSPSSSNSGSSSSSSSGSPSSNGNSGGGNATAILQSNSTQLIVTVQLDASKQSEAKVGEPVTVEMPNGNTVDARISAVSPVAQSSNNSGNGATGGGNAASGNNNANNSNNGGSSGSSGSTIPVTVTLSGHQTGAGLDQAAVSVNFSQAQANNVLSVPVTALLATAGGGYAVQEAAAPHTLIPVTTGLFAAGYVQISGQGIYPGLQVSDSQG